MESAIPELHSLVVTLLRLCITVPCPAVSLVVVEIGISEKEVGHIDPPFGVGFSFAGHLPLILQNKVVNNAVVLAFAHIAPDANGDVDIACCLELQSVPIQSVVESIASSIAPIRIVVCVIWCPAPSRGIIAKRLREDAHHWCRIVAGIEVGVQTLGAIVISVIGHTRRSIAIE